MATTVLIVEDNALNLKFFDDLLQSHGYDTLPAHTGEEALSLAAKRRPDVVLLDLRLPGISGLEVCTRLKADAATKSIPVVAVTAMTLREDEARMRAAGCDGYLKKPIAGKLLLETVAEMTARTQGPRPTTAGNLT
jgi:two-component system cell cycle response regulator DivK